MTTAAAPASTGTFMNTGQPLFSDLPFKVRDLSPESVDFGRKEVREMALIWKEQGALLFGLSDKPDEASVPGAELAAQGHLPIHRAETHAVGT